MPKNKPANLLEALNTKLKGFFANGKTQLDFKFLQLDPDTC